MEQEILRFLEIIGVNNRFISVYNKSIYINNLKFSRFSRKREGLFLNKYPEWKIVRSKVFQKMCLRSSRILNKSLNPGERIFIEKSSKCTNLALYIIMEPYTRKYGVEIVYSKDLELLSEVDKKASPTTLDQEAKSIIHKMLHGEKIEVTFLKTKSRKNKTIYPLINIPNSWIESWANDQDFKCNKTNGDKVISDLLGFLEEFIPDVRENILKSAWYITDKKKGI